MSETVEALREEIERLRAKIREARAESKPESLGQCEQMGRFRHLDGEFGQCRMTARWVVNGKKVCAAHRGLRSRNWRVRVVENAARGFPVTLKPEEVAEVAALLTAEPLPDPPA